ncbi:hypothetical protein BM1_07361 [Bipolaris maydis]|nr:hypothetical protein BM1_07361 [Bipolaris maydis]
MALYLAELGEDRFETAEDMISLLKTYFVSGNEQAESRAAFHRLSMEKKETFPEFKARFISAAVKGSVSRLEWFFYLWEKITPALRMPNLGFKHLWAGSFEKMVQHLTAFDMERRNTLFGLPSDHRPNSGLPSTKQNPRPNREYRPRSYDTRPDSVPTPPRAVSSTLRLPSKTPDPEKANYNNCYNCGLEVDPEKVEALKDWKPPTTVTGVKSFLGFTGFYRQFVPEYSRVAKPLLALQSPSRPFVWDSDCQAAFVKLKSALLLIPTLYHYQPEYDTKVETDASDGVVAGVLSQLQPNDKWYPVAFFSKVLAGSELNWEIHDKELFAIVTAFSKWRPELLSAKSQVDVYSDHRSLEYFMSTKVLNARQARWAEELAPFNFLIRYTPGKSNARADILSRREQDMENLKLAQTDNRSRVLLGPHRLDNRINSDLAEIFIIQKHQQLTAISAIEPSSEPMSLDSLELIEAILQLNRSSFQEQRALLPEGYRLQGDLLLYADRLCIPSESILCTRLIREAHDQISSAHPSAKKTYQLLARKYYWKDFKEFPRDRSGYDMIMVVIDRLSKQAISIPCHKTITARGIAELFIQWSEFCRILGVKVKLSTAYHKETDGQTEIMNKYIDQRLRPFVTYYQDNWSGLLPLIDRAQISLPHSSIGMSPYRILYGTEPRQSWDWDQAPKPSSTSNKLNQAEALALASRMHEAWKIAKEQLEKTQERMRTVVNRHRRPIDWKVGDQVFLDTRNLNLGRPSRKLSDKWEGPFKVLEQVGNSYRLQLPEGSRILDVFAPELLCKDPQDPLPGQEAPKPPGIPICGVDEWEVEEILANMTRTPLSTLPPTSWEHLTNSNSSMNKTQPNRDHPEPYQDDQI